jgi:hypothetical protein
MNTVARYGQELLRMTTDVNFKPDFLVVDVA